MRSTSNQESMERNQSSIGQLRLSSAALAPLAPWSHRIGWLHIPKSGTSFGTSLAHLANASLPRDAAIVNEVRQGRSFILRYPHDEWFRGIFWRGGAGQTIFGDHRTLSPRSGWSPNYVGLMFVMVREPSSCAAR